MAAVLNKEDIKYGSTVKGENVHFPVDAQLNERDAFVFICIFMQL